MSDLDGVDVVSLHSSDGSIIITGSGAVDLRAGGGGPPTGVAGGDLSGFYPNPLVDGLQGVGVSAAVPVNGNVLTLVLGVWTPAAPAAVGGPPTGPAGGDLTGTYPNPTVDGLQGVAVSAAVPVAGDVLTLVAGIWTPAATAGGPPTGAAGGDLAGLYPNPTVDGLQGTPVSAAAPVAGNVLTLVAGVWTPAAPASVAPSGAAGGDLGGTYPNPTVDGLQGVGVSAAAPAAGDVLTLVLGVWTPAAPASVAPSGPAGGDLNGTYPNPTVDGLQGTPVSAAVPVAGNVLTLVAGVWTPAAPASVSPSGAAGGDLSGTYPNPTVDGLQGTAVSAVAPVAGDVLTLVAGVWTPAAPAGGAPSGPAGGDLNGTYPNPTVDGLQGVAVSAAVPVAGNVLTLVAGVWTPAAPASVSPSGAAGGDLSGTYPNPTVDGWQGVGISATAPVQGDFMILGAATWQLSGTDLGLVRIRDSGGAPLMTWFGSATTSFAVGAAGADGFEWFLITSSPPGVGARARGGDIRMETGAGNGNAGAGAQGGSFQRIAGDGSDNGGAGGDIEEFTGNGGAGGGTAGSYQLVLGVPNGAGNHGTWTVFQGGSGGDPVLELDGGGIFHVGKDSDTAAGQVRLRINGSEVTTVGAAGAAAALPLFPVSYIAVDINGTVRNIPCYNT